MIKVKLDHGGGWGSPSPHGRHPTGDQGADTRSGKASEGTGRAWPPAGQGGETGTAGACISDRSLQDHEKINLHGSAPHPTPPRPQSSYFSGQRKQSNITLPVIYQFLTFIFYFLTTSAFPKVREVGFCPLMHPKCIEVCPTFNNLWHLANI